MGSIFFSSNSSSSTEWLQIQMAKLASPVTSHITFSAASIFTYCSSTIRQCTSKYNEQDADANLLYYYFLLSHSSLQRQVEPKLVSPDLAKSHSTLKHFLASFSCKQRIALHYPLLFVLPSPLILNTNFAVAVKV